jgi:hypothetical protein
MGNAQPCRIEAGEKHYFDRDGFNIQLNYFVNYVQTNCWIGVYHPHDIIVGNYIKFETLPARSTEGNLMFPATSLLEGRKYIFQLCSGSLLMKKVLATSAPVLFTSVRNEVRNETRNEMQAQIEALQLENVKKQTILEIELKQAKKREQELKAALNKTSGEVL